MTTFAQTQASETLQWAQANPVGWTRRILGFRPWKRQRDILMSVRDNERTSVKSGHGIGKTGVAAATCLWFLYSFPESIVITTATRDIQVRQQLWGEIRRMCSHSRVPLGGEVLQTELKLGDGWYAAGFTAKDETSFQGYHPPSGNILFVYDEAPGVEDRFWDAAEGCMTSEGARWLAIGNPLAQEGKFYETFRDPNWNNMTISCLDSPNVRAERIVIKGLVTRSWVEGRKRGWGEGTALYQSRVLGQFPETTIDTLIPLAWVEKSIDSQWVKEDEKDVATGVDVARFGSDRTVFCTRKGERVVEVEAFQGMDTMQTAGRARAKSLIYDGSRITIDETGLGGGPYDRLVELGVPVMGVTFGSSAMDVDLFGDIQTEMYWNLRLRFENTAKGKNGPKISIPNDAELIADLTMRKYKVLSTGQYKMESKDQFRKRKSRSPDKGDALALCFARGPEILVDVI